jgi:hypothetical protein
MGFVSNPFRLVVSPDAKQQTICVTNDTPPATYFSYFHLITIPLGSDKPMPSDLEGGRPRFVSQERLDLVNLDVRFQCLRGNLMSG